MSPKDDTMQSSKSKKDRNTSSSSNNHAKRQNGGGVADYFAILGIGDTLELKSTQKKYQRVAVNNNVGDDEIEQIKQREIIQQEEECSLIERFYREIVQVSIFTAYTDKRNGAFVGGSLATSTSAFSGGDEEDDNYNNSAYRRDDNEEYDINYEPDKGFISKGRYQISSIVPSPTKMFRKTLLNRDDHDNQPQQQQSSSLLPKDISGFEILYQTITNINEQGQTPNSQTGIGPNASNISYGTIDNDLSLNATFTLNNSASDNLDSNKSTQQQPLDADLNPKLGLLSIVNRFDNNIIPQQDLSFSNLSFESSNIQQQSQPSQQQKQQQADHQDSWSKLNFRRRGGNVIPKKIHEQIISPMFATKSKAVAVAGTCIDGEKDDNKSNSSSIMLDKHFYIGYRRRGADETNKSAVASLQLMYCRLHNATILDTKIEKTFQSLAGNVATTHNIPQASSNQYVEDNNLDDFGNHQRAPKNAADALRRGLFTGANLAKRVAVSSKNRILRGRSMDQVDENEDNKENDYDEEESHNESEGVEDQSSPYDNHHDIIANNAFETVSLHEVLRLPQGFDNGEWIIPCAYQLIKIPCSNDNPLSSLTNQSLSQYDKERIKKDRHSKKAYLFNHKSSPTWGEGVGIEAFVPGDVFLQSNANVDEKSSETGRRNPWSPGGGDNGAPKTPEFRPNSRNSFDGGVCNHCDVSLSREELMPSIIPYEKLSSMLQKQEDDDDQYQYVPIIAVRRQRIGEEERFHEDPGIVDIALTLSGKDGSVVLPEEEVFDEFDDNNDEEDDILGKSKWSESSIVRERIEDEDMIVIPSIIFRRNLPRGFADTPFATGVLDRFPKKDYKGVPLPEEELPMFCYPTGCRLFRARYQDAPLAEYYGFVVKNERGDNIHGKKKNKYITIPNFPKPQI